MTDAPPRHDDHRPHRKRNRLANEKSPYLLQHAENPVDWYPWGDEAFAAARRLDRPVLLSIGYATCHWCHVMAHESFEDPGVAELMNRTFVNVKVDREERPDVDQVYMTVCQMLTGSGGWPLTILLTPDRTPFFAATYIPRESRFGRPGMTDLVPRVAQLWRDDRERLVASATEIQHHLQRATAGSTPARVDPQVAAESAARDLAARYDSRHGGFGSAPKFPSPHQLIFLVDRHERAGDVHALQMVEHTLSQMRRGGIFDQIGFGYHRYATDSGWRVPHFEKMLYDQAMHVLALAEAHRATDRARYARWADEVLTYVLRDMTSPAGGFFSAEDADSEGEEGRFYVWTMAEIRDILGDEDAGLVAEAWTLRPDGNWSEESSGRTTGTNIPFWSDPPAVVAARLDLTEERLEQRMEGIRERLFQARLPRVHPLKDDKVLTDWNGLMAAAMARAGRLLGRTEPIAAASRAVRFVEDHLRSSGGALLHRHRDGDASVPAFLDDHVFLAWGHLELYEATLEVDHLQSAMDLMDAAVAGFWDEAHGGFFFAPDSPELPARPKDGHDGAIPSGNAVAAWNLVRLSRLTGRPDLERRALDTVAAFATDVQRAPSAHAHLLGALLHAADPSLEVVVVGDPAQEDTSALLDIVSASRPRRGAVLLVSPGDDGEIVRRLAPFAASMTAVDGRAAAYVCRDFRCQLPITDPAELDRALAEALP